MSQVLPGRVGSIGTDGELPRRQDLAAVFDELDFQLACQAPRWALPRVSYVSYADGPLESYFDRSWKLGDVTEVGHG